MIKIPATLAGLPAIEQAIAKGININVTLIFSIERYVKVMQAYQSGLERRVRSKLPLNDISSVASFFVSRVDTMVDKALQAVGKESLLDTETTKKLKGKAAIANAKLAYQSFQTFVQTKQYLKLRENKARYQRPLWASTSTKNPDFPDTYYVDNLIGPHTVNTVPPDTFDAFQDHGTAEPTLLTGVEEAASTIEAIENLGISMKVVTDRLENEGVEKFAASYANLVDTVRVMVGTLREFGTL
jgi:transaldolase